MDNNAFKDIFLNLPEEAKKHITDFLKDLFSEEMEHAHEIAKSHYIKAIETMRLAELPHQLGINEMYEISAIGMISAMISDNLDRERIIELMTKKVGHLYDTSEKKIKELRASGEEFTI